MAQQESVSHSTDAFEVFRSALDQTFRSRNDVKFFVCST